MNKFTINHIHIPFERVVGVWVKVHATPVISEVFTSLDPGKEGYECNDEEQLKKYWKWLGEKELIHEHQLYEARKANGYYADITPPR